MTKRSVLRTIPTQLSADALRAVVGGADDTRICVKMPIEMSRPKKGSGTTSD